MGPEEDLFNEPDLAPEDMEFEVVTTSDGIGKYTSRELRAILKQIDALPESKAGLLHSVNDQISIQVQKVLAKEKELEPWTAITSAAEKHKLDQLTALEK